MSDNNFKFGKKAQAAETMTWVVATLIIIFILLVSVFLSAQIAKTKKSVNYFQELNQQNILEDDLLMQESVFAYFSISQDKKSLIYNKLELLDKQKKFYSDFKNKINEINSNVKN